MYTKNDINKSNCFVFIQFGISFILPSESLRRKNLITKKQDLSLFLLHTMT